jgi:thiamine biosynthesis lipoprotein
MPISLAGGARQVSPPRGGAGGAAGVADGRAPDRVFSTYRDDSAISRLGRGEITLADCPPEVREVLELGQIARVQSDGAFDVRRRTATGETVLDPSGVVKGWAVQRASGWLHALPDTDFCLSAGGDMVCHTDDPAGQPWRVGIEDPADPHRLIAIVPVRRGAVATSGTAHRGEHVVDARTGRPPPAVASVTVVAGTLTWADIDATAAYALDGGAATWLRARTGRAGLVVWRDGRVELIG